MCLQSLSALFGISKIIFSQGEACIAKGELDSAFPQFHISLV